MNHQQDTNSEIQQLIDQGDHALAELFSHYQDRLGKMVRFRLDRRLWGRVDPDDILQEAYIDISQRLSSYLKDGAGPVFTWFRRITKQTMINVHRRHLGMKIRNASLEVSLHHSPMATSVSLAARLVANLTSPSKTIMREEMLDELRKAFEGMDSIDREVLALRHFEELSNTEVAEVLGIKMTAASNRYMRALKRLKAILTKMEFSEFTI